MNLSILWLQEICGAASHASKLMENVLAESVVMSRARLVHVLGQYPDRDMAKKVIGRYSNLPPSFQTRLLLSAELGNILKFHDLGPRKVEISDDTMTSLCDMVEREQLICYLVFGIHFSINLSSVEGTKHWSPLGDAFAVAEKKGFNLVRVPVIGGSMAVDDESPLAASYETHSGVLSQPRKLFSSEERKVVVDRLSNAMKIIDEVEPTYGMIVRNFNRRILLRKSIDSIGELEQGQSPLGSETSFRHPGTIRLLNPHLEENTEEFVVEAILHESMHCMMMQFESVDQKKFVEDHMDYRPVSAWSGNAIPNSSLSHAIVIYYVLFRFFVRWLDRKRCTGIGDTSIIKKRIFHFCAGFILSDHVTDYFSHGGSKNTNFMKFANFMQKEVKDKMLELDMSDE